MKKIVIMGASSGIGLALAEAFASRGVRVGIAARHTAAMEALGDRYPGFVEYASIDINRPEAAGQLVQLADSIGGMDIYVHVAGIGYENLTLDPEREAAIVSTNSVGFARMISAAYRYMRDRGIHGRIAAVTSVAGTKGIGRLSAYSSSKKFGQTYLVALEQLSNAEKSKIKFTDIRPGWVRTPLLLPGVRYPMEMSLDDVVPAIIKAIARGERVCVIDRRWKALADVWRRLPDSLWVKADFKISHPDQRYPTVAEEVNDSKALEAR